MRDYLIGSTPHLNALPTSPIIRVRLAQAVDQDTQKEMLAWHFKRSEEWKVRCTSTEALGVMFAGGIAGLDIACPCHA